MTAGAHGKVVVGSGWWCDGKPTASQIGDPRTLSVWFFERWYAQVRRCLRPSRIVVTDSASPVKPDHASLPDLVWIELDANYGHANDIRLGRIATKYCGFTRSVLCGAMFALSCDADVYVYVEQDCLVKGDDFLTQAIGDSACDVLIGARTENGRGLNGGAAAPMPQQSLIVVRGPGLPRFIGGLLASPWTDGERSPEEIMAEVCAPVDTLRVPYGRSRPIDYARSPCYVHHLQPDELERFLESC